MSVDSSPLSHISFPSRPGPKREHRESAEVDAWNFHRRFAALALMATGFVLLGGGNLDLGPNESRLGLASFERLGPFGQAFGSWEPTVWPVPLAASLMWAWGEGGMPTTASIRWPAAIAGLAIGLIVARRVVITLGGRAGVLLGLTWFGSIALIDHTDVAGLDLIAGLCLVATLDRLLGPGSDLLTGILAALAFLAGGWPPLTVVVLATVVLGRAHATLSWRLLLPPLLAFVGWSAWCLSVAPAEAWGAALAIPLTEKPAWLFALQILALGLPWSPFAALACSRNVRDGWPRGGRAFVAGWLQFAGASVLAGTLIPGLAHAASVPSLVGLSVAAAAGIDRILEARVSAQAQRWFFVGVIFLSCGWALIAIVAGGYLATAVGYYRALSLTLIVLAVPVAFVSLRSARRQEPRNALLALFALAVCLKVAHWGYYVPEWNYRLSQGPWGRAVGQWVPPRWPIYTTHTWRTEFAFATGHPFRQLVSPQHLAFEPGPARFVLLLASEFENWPPQAPPLTKVASFQDEYDRTRILARTDGPLPWTRPMPSEGTD
ncbi:MAG: hypothetical protein NVSMB9_21190 [Isosphaeraceae bacterium]